MTGGTEVDTGELRTFAGGMHGRSDEILAASDKVGAIDYGVFSFGIIAQLFVDDARAAANRAAEGLMLLGKNVGMDATAVGDAATWYDDNEQNQVQRFGGDTHG
ncbi:type VII secretion target [Actinophytocola sp.]|uniref:type VII secretion target n=1 Tax=Actinophytocola sp. TaxID=1872138 RepID=UPI002ED8364D